MRTLLICIFFILFGSSWVRAITLDELLLSSDKFEKEQMRRFRRLPCYDRTDTFRVLTCFHLDLSTGSQDIFTNDHLLNHLDFDRRPRKPWMESCIYTELDRPDTCRIVAWGDSFFNTVICLYEDSYRDVEYFAIKQELDVFFTVNQIGEIYWGIKDGEFYVISKENDDSDYSLLPLELFVQEYWHVLYQNSFDPLKDSYFMENIPIQNDGTL